MHSLTTYPLALEVLPCWTLAAFCADLGPVRAVRPAAEIPREVYGDPLREMQLAIPELGYRQSVSLGDGETLVEAPPGREVEDALGRVAGPMHLELQVTVGDDEETIPITIRPPWHLAHDRASRVTVAAMVVPGDDRVLETMNTVLFGPGRAGAATPAGLLGPDRPAPTAPPGDLLGPEGLAGIPRRLYRHLQETWQIQYREPRRETDEWSDGSCQRVRPPAEVLRGDRGPVGEGNCLDLALLMAGCLETVGVKPLVLFTGAPDAPPEHVFLGWWTNPGQRFRPLLTDPEQLEEMIAGGELQVIEPTGICPDPHRLDFDQAGARARQFFRGPVHAVDVSATRPPAGRVRSLVLGNEPLVQHAIWTAQVVADRPGVSHRETTHLLYGLCAVGAELTESLIRLTGGDPGRLCSLIEGADGQGVREGASRPTQNYRLCLEAARLNARARGSGVVTEADLLWAIIENPSRNVVRVLCAAGCDPTRFVEELQARARRGDEQSLSRRFDDT